MHKLVGAYWIKSEAFYLPEYLEFHLLQGFDHFIFYDNFSTDNTRDILRPYTDAGLIELRTYPPHIVQRNNFYMMTTLINELKGKCHWLAFHAIDERMFCPDGKLIPDLLEEYSKYGGLCVAWEEFNSNGKLTKEPGLITDRFTTTCRDTAQHIKTICRPDVTLDHEGDPHNFRFKSGFNSVDENHKVVTGPWNTKNPYTFNKIKNHHYRTMSAEEYNKKASKGLLDHPGQENIRRPDADAGWDWCHNRAEQGTNTDLLKWSQPVKNALKARYKDYPEQYKLIKEWYAIND